MVQHEMSYLNITPMKKSQVVSLTKIMFAVVALEYGKLSDTTLISQKAADMTESSVYLNVGQEVTLRDLLYALMLRSGNDARIAIAEMIGGLDAKRGLFI